MKNLDEKVAEAETDLGKKDSGDFRKLSIGGLLAGAVAVYGGINMGSEMMEGVGYGILIMDTFVSACYGLRKYLRSE